SPSHRRHPRPRVARVPSLCKGPRPLFLPRDETERLPVRGERSSRQRQLPGGTAKKRSSAIDFDRQQPIEGEIDCQRSISAIDDRLREKSGRLREKKGRRRRGKEEKRREEENLMSSLLAHHRRGSPRALARFFSHTKRQNVSPRREKDRGNIASTATHCVYRPIPISYRQYVDIPVRTDKSNLGTNYCI
ncbi:hypothetical protein GW17_00040502, partial [Ensete ventricosum]